MTEKQQNIISAALKLFGQNGYAATSTKKIAVEAGVSEGLIFRHFGNKEGLAKVILEEGEDAYTALVMPVLQMDDPEQLLRAFITGIIDAFDDENARLYWVSLLKMKIELGVSNEEKYVPVIARLAWALESYGFNNGTAVARALLSAQEGMLSAMINNDKATIENIATGMLRLLDLE